MEREELEKPGMTPPRGVAPDGTTMVDRAALPLGEIGDILRHIEQNLAFQPLLRRGDPRRQDRARLLPSLAAWEERVQSLRRLNAPFFVPEAPGPATWVRRALNLPLRVFGHKQAQFNDQMVGLIGEMVQELHRTVTRQAQILSALSRELEELREKDAPVPPDSEQRHGPRSGSGEA